MKSIKNIILIYVALRSTLAVFWGVNIIGSFNILELVGFFFPVFLLSYWIITNFRGGGNSYRKLYLLIVIWVLLTTVFKMFNYGFGGIQSFSGFFRILNGFTVFMVFPLIFKDQKSINSLMNAFFIATIFPIIQGLAQLMLGVNFGGMRTSSGSAYAGGPEMYYGLYNKYDGYAWAALLGGLVMVYKIGLTKNLVSMKGCIYGVFLVLYFVLASLTLSRTLICNMAIVSIALIIAISSGKPGFRTITILFIMLVSIFFITKSDFIQGRYEQLMNRSETEFRILSGDADIEGAFHGRIGLWKYKLEQFYERPLVDRLIGTNINIGPHGDYIIWLLQYGYTGIVLYGLLLVCLLLGSIHTFFCRIDRIHNLFLWPYGLMVISGLLVWLLGSIIYNASQYPDYSYFIIGNTAILLSIGKRYEHKQKDCHFYGSYASSIYGAKYCNSDNP